MIRADDRTLEKRPHVFESVGVRQTANVNTRCMVNRNVDRIIVVHDPVVSVMSICRKHSSFVGKFGFQKSAEVFFPESVNAARLKPDFAVAFNRTKDAFLVSYSAALNATSPLLAFVHPFGSASDIGFVGFNKAGVKAKERRVGILHGLTDTMTEIPRRLIGHAQNALELQSRYTFFGFADKIGSDEPFTKRQVRVMENRSGSNGKVIAAGCTLKLVALVVTGYLFRAATDTANAFRPSQLLKSNAAFFV